MEGNSKASAILRWIVMLPAALVVVWLHDVRAFFRDRIGMHVVCGATAYLFKKN